MQIEKLSVDQNVLIRSIRGPFCLHSFSLVTRILNPEGNEDKIPEGEKRRYNIKNSMCSVDP